MIKDGVRLVRGTLRFFWRIMILKGDHVGKLYLYIYENCDDQ